MARLRETLGDALRGEAPRPPGARAHQGRLDDARRARGHLGRLRPLRRRGRVRRRVFGFGRERPRDARPRRNLEKRLRRAARAAAGRARTPAKASNGNVLRDAHQNDVDLVSARGRGAGGTLGGARRPREAGFRRGPRRVVARARQGSSRERDADGPRTSVACARRAKTPEENAAARRTTRAISTAGTSPSASRPTRTGASRGWAWRTTTWGSEARRASSASRGASPRDWARPRWITGRASTRSGRWTSAATRCSAATAGGRRASPLWRARLPGRIRRGAP